MPWFSGGRTRVFSTITGSWPLGIMILIGLGLMAFFPVKPKKLADSGREARPQADPFTRTASAPAVPPGSNPLAYLEVADFMGGDFDAQVNQIEEDLIQACTDRATYLQRRQALVI